jgi:uncharacterized protein (DUF885 family)
MKFDKRDPTANVLMLFENFAGKTETARLADIRRVDDLRNAETQRVNEILSLRGQHAKELGEKEANRLDSIRQVDVLNQAAAAKSALDAIQALALTTNVNADNIRNALNATATLMAKQTTDLAAAIATQTAATAEALSQRIAALEKASAEGIGKGRVIDPQLDELLREMKSVNIARSMGQGESKGRSDIVGWIIGGVMFVIAVATFVLANLKP